MSTFSLRPYSSTSHSYTPTGVQCAMKASKYERTAYCYETNGLCTIGNIFGNNNPTNDWTDKPVFVGEHFFHVLIKYTTHV